MSLSINNPTIRDLGPIGNGGRELYELCQPLVVHLQLESAAGGIRVKVPKGYRTDFASVPRPLWPLFPPFGRYARAAIVHDYLYSTNACSRFLADCLFRELMFHLKVPTHRRVIMYYAVRGFGWIGWRKHPEIKGGRNAPADSGGNGEG
jgi:hypothetical protein